jgi:hypothetical protein
MGMNSGRTDAATGRPPTPDRPFGYRGAAAAGWRWCGAEGFCARQIRLPNWRHITAADVDRVAKVVTCQLTSPPVATHQAQAVSGL